VNLKHVVVGVAVCASCVAGAAEQASVAGSASDIMSTPPGTVMIKEYVATVGRLAYVWGWALVNNFNRSLAVKDLPEPGRIGGVIPGSPHNQISMLSDYIDSAENFVTCPNQDTVYGAGYMTLDTSPVIIQVPNFGNRFYTYQLSDARTDSFGRIGKQYGTKPGFHLWSARIGKARFLRELSLFIDRPPISLRFSRAFSRTIRRKTRSPFSPC
jgi:hypothetical protein